MVSIQFLFHFPLKATLAFLAQSKRFKLEFLIALKRLRDFLEQETIDTVSMLNTYQRYSVGKATKEEMNIANQQFRDVIKSLGLGILLVLPFAPLTIPSLVKLGRLLGIDILPSSFKTFNKDFKNEGPPPKPRS